MKRLLFHVLLLLLSLVAFSLESPAWAQTYGFAVPSLKMTATVQPDASVQVVYDIDFQNMPGMSPIDIVDVGLPAEGTPRVSMSAALDGKPLTDIRPSQYVHPGVEVHLGEAAIPAGQSGTLHFEYTQPDMVFEDVTSGDLASFRITPTWFGAAYVRGQTDLEITVIVPGELSPDELVWHQQAFTQKAIVDGGVAVLFSFPDTPLVGPHLVGLSFPRRVMSRVVQQSAWDLAVEWFVDHPQLRAAWGLGILVVGAFVFFRFSGRTGCVVYGALALGLVGLFSVAPGAQLLAPLPLVGLLVLNERALRRKKGHYLPPIAQVEGGGIKRGLTAPQAAILLELPFGKVLQLVLVGLLKKGILRLDPTEPGRALAGEGLDAVIHDPTALAAAAQERGIVLTEYETSFADIAVSHNAGTLPDQDFSRALKALIAETVGRMKGFDLSDTQDYYRHVITRALRQVEGLPELPARGSAADKDLEWLLMDPAGTSVLSRPGRAWTPAWFPVPVRLGPRPTAGLSAPSSAPRVGAPGTSSLTDVAAGFAGWAEHTASGLATTLTPASLGMPDMSKGAILDLSGIDRASSAVLSAMVKASAHSSGRGGGGGCACACAGCACACACAGGGR